MEGEAAAIYRFAGVNPDQAMSPGELCRRCLGTAPQFAPLRVEAALCRVRDEWRVFVRKGTRPTRARWLVGHELAEWWLKRQGHTGEDIEQRCDAIGAALVAPAPVVRRAMRLDGDDPIALAQRLKTTESLALLRVGEVTGQPVLLAHRHGAIARGDCYAWPHDASWHTAQTWQHAGIKRVEISDAAKRLGVVAA